MSIPSNRENPSPIQTSKPKPEESNSFVFGQSMQDYLSLGYLYLLLLGISSDSIYYGLMGVNILSYSSVLDVILSPVIYLTRNLAFPSIIFLIPGLMTVMLWYSRRNHLKKREDPEYQAKHDIDKLDKAVSKPEMVKKTLLLGAFVIFSAYLGYGLGGGMKMRENLKEGKMKMTHILTFTDGEELPVKLIGQNSDYVFYVKEGMKAVSITPIPGNIKVIEKKVKAE